MEIMLTIFTLTIGSFIYLANRLDKKVEKKYVRVKANNKIDKRRLEEYYRDLR